MANAECRDCSNHASFNSALNGLMLMASLLTQSKPEGLFIQLMTPMTNVLAASPVIPNINPDMKCNF